MLDRELGMGLVVIGGSLCQFVAVHRGEAEDGCWVSQIKCGPTGPLTKGALGPWGPEPHPWEIPAMFHLASLQCIMALRRWTQITSPFIKSRAYTAMHILSDPRVQWGISFITNAPQSLAWDSLLSVIGESWVHSLTMYFGPQRAQRNPTFLCFLKHKKNVSNFRNNGKVKPTITREYSCSLEAIKRSKRVGVGGETL